MRRQALIDRLSSDSATAAVPLRLNGAALEALRPRYRLAFEVARLSLTLPIIFLAFYFVPSWLVPLIGRPGGGEARVPQAMAMILFALVPSLAFIAVNELAERLGERLGAAWLGRRHGWSRSEADRLFHDSRIPEHWLKPTMASRDGRMDQQRARVAARLAAGMPRFVLLRGLLPGALLGPLLPVAASVLSGRLFLFSRVDPMLFAATAALGGLLGAVLSLQIWRGMKASQAWRARMWP